MFARVLKRYIDKNTKVLHEVDDVVEVTKARYNELRKAGDYVVEVKDEVVVNETELPVNEAEVLQEEAGEVVNGEEAQVEAE